MTRCINETCTENATVHTPVSLCTPCAIETALGVLPLALANALTDARETTTAPADVETVEPTERERAAITALRITNAPITRRTVGQAIRSIGGTCSTDRANALSAWARSGSDLALFDQET
ncbi:hypothetical protein ACFV2X_37850 [Streptomyces sp. NPDC059679]|uniref:hypothetical protein n=1 Tax=Streptomyces sp. NPDC059679 TaxID=3346903 RepID=UPI0036CEF5DB